MPPKKIRGRKRHVVTDTSGLLVGVVVHPADIQDRDGAGLVIEAIHDLFPWLRHLFADSVYNGPNLRAALVKFRRLVEFEIVKRAAATPVSAAAAALGGRTHLGLVEPQPPSRQRLRGVDRQRRRLGLYCLNATPRPAISTNTTSAILSQTLSRRGIEQVGADCTRRVNPEQQDQHRRHQRPAANAGQPDKRTHAKARQRIKRVDRPKPVHSLACDNPIRTGPRRPPSFKTAATSAAAPWDIRFARAPPV